MCFLDKYDLMLLYTNHLSNYLSNNIEYFMYNYKLYHSKPPYQYTILYFIPREDMQRDYENRSALRILCQILNRWCVIVVVPLNADCIYLVHYSRSLSMIFDSMVKMRRPSRR